MKEKEHAQYEKSMASSSGNKSSNVSRGPGLNRNQ
jgi:hypothetical protein